MKNPSGAYTSEGENIVSSFTKHNEKSKHMF
nr:MAG TPA: hypothetical protein [Caudoviricetes sp.]